jgi:hypothetical protein
MFPLCNLTLVGELSGKISVQDIDVAERVIKGASKALGGECLKVISLLSDNIQLRDLVKILFKIIFL